MHLFVEDIMTTTVIHSILYGILGILRMSASTQVILLMLILLEQSNTYGAQPCMIGIR